MTDFEIRFWKLSEENHSRGDSLAPHLTLNNNLSSLISPH